MSRQAVPSLRQALGLTLVELLLTITLFMVLMGSVAALVRSSLTVQRTWGQSVEPYERLERVLSRIERDLTSAQPFFGVPVVVEADRVEVARVDRASAEWLRVVYRLADTAEGKALIREEYLWRDAAGQAQPLQEETLLPLEQGQFAFGVVDAQTATLMWVQDWDGQANGVPRLVKFDCTVRLAGAQAPLALSRIFRNPAGTLPIVEQP